VLSSILQFGGFRVLFIVASSLAALFVGLSLVLRHIDKRFQPAHPVMKAQLDETEVTCAIAEIEAAHA